jgi:hypothetical protein
VCVYVFSWVAKVRDRGMQNVKTVLLLLLLLLLPLFSKLKLHNIWIIVFFSLFFFFLKPELVDMCFQQVAIPLFQLPLVE